LGALPESTQLTGCAEGRELLTLFLTWSWHPSWSPSYRTQQQWPQRKLWPFWSSLDSCLQNDRYLRRTCRGCFPDAFCARLRLASRPYQACWLGLVWNRKRTGCWSPLTSQKSWRSWRGFRSWISPDCHDRDIRSPCTLLSDCVHTFAVCLLYVLPFPFLSICSVSPPIGERIVRSVSLYDYLICFLSCFRSLYVPVPFHY